MPVYALLGRWATRIRAQLGMVEGGERGGGRQSPSTVIPSDLNRQHAADITTAVAKERTNYVSRDSKINK